jgi:rhamnosyltransferase
MAKYDATVAVLAFNGEEFLDDLLVALFNQKTKYTYEVLVIDSGSVDKTLDIVAKYPKVRLHQISNKEFSHGRTRNLAVELADSDFVLFLTQDAVPSYPGWLDGMLEPFGISDKVGCVFGKQIPRADCFATLKKEVVDVFKSFGDDGSISLQRKSSVTAELGITNNFFSDVNSAVRKSISKKVPFQNVSYAEDQVLGIDMLDAGYYKAYAPLGSVYHSHNYPLNKYFKRKFDENVGLRESTGYVPYASLKELYLGTIKASLKDWVFVIRDRDYSFTRKLHDIILVPFYNFANRRAMRAAANVEMANKNKEKFSLEAKARQNTKN